MNFRKLTVVAVFAVLFISLLALPTFAKDAIREEDSPYYLIVGDAYVTDANKADILGDGTAVFDSENYVLTLKNYVSEKTSSLIVDSQTGYKAFFSVFYPGEKDLTVRIEGNCHFMSAVRVDHGTIEVKDATVTFSEHASAMFESEYGLLSVQNSKITVESVNYLTPLSEDRKEQTRAIAAGSIQINESTIICDVPSPFIVYHDMFMYAYNDFVIEDSRVSVSSPFPIFDCVFFAQSGLFGMDEVRLSVKGQATALASFSKIFSAIDSAIEIKNCESAFAVAKLSLDDCDVKVSTFRDAIAIQGEDAESVSVIIDSKVKLTCLSQNTYESVFGKNFWKALGDTEKLEFENDFDKFMEAHYEGRPYSNVRRGIAVDGGVLNFEKCKVTVKGYDIGIYAQGDTYFKLHKGVRAIIKSNRAAFFAVSTVAVSPFATSDPFRSFSKDLETVKLPNNLSGRGDNFYTFAWGKVEVGALAADASLAALADAVDGAARNLRLHTSGALPVGVTVLLFFVAILAVLVVLAVVFFIFLPHPKK